MNLLKRDRSVPKFTDKGLFLWKKQRRKTKTIPSEPFWSIHPRNRLKFSRRFVLFFIQFSLIFVFWHWKIDVAQEPLKYHIALHLFMLWGNKRVEYSDIYISYSIYATRNGGIYELQPDEN